MGPPPSTQLGTQQEGAATSTQLGTQQEGALRNNRRNVTNNIRPATGVTPPPSKLPALPPVPTLPPASVPVVNKEPAMAAVAAGGGISRKRSDPMYISQISDNRSKIFKKELEIINSIRRFHRSHTIRKRDKINSILGLRKSRNSKSSVNSKNTRRHVHRNNNHNHKHKHKSTKHIKK